MLGHRSLSDDALGSTGSILNLLVSQVDLAIGQTAALSGNWAFHSTLALAVSPTALYSSLISISSIEENVLDFAPVVLKGSFRVASQIDLAIDSEADLFVTAILPTNTSVDEDIVFSLVEANFNFSFEVESSLNDGLPAEAGGIFYALIEETPWSSIDGVKVGYRIVELGGPGVATIIEEPTYKRRSIKVQITEAFSDRFVIRNSWALYPREGPDFTRYYSRDVRRTSLIPDYVDEYKTDVYQEVDDSCLRLLDVRAWDKTENSFLRRLTNFLGLFVDLTSIPEESQRRVIFELRYLHEISGTQGFMDFIGFVLNGIFHIAPLWTNDYRVFVEGPPPNSTYYPTNHVSISYYPGEFTGSEQDIIDLFYVLASVPVVIDTIQTIVHFNPNAYYSSNYYTITEDTFIAR